MPRPSILLGWINEIKFGKKWGGKFTHIFRRFRKIPKSEYSDTSANEDNSFRNHILLPKSSLAETLFPVGFYRK